MSHEVFTIGQVAKLCHVAHRTAVKWFDRGMLKGFRVPGSKHRRVTQAVLAEFMRQHGLPMPAEWARSKKETTEK